MPLHVNFFYLQKVAEGATEVSSAQVCISNRSESVSWELEGCIQRQRFVLVGSQDAWACKTAILMLERDVLSYF